MANSREHLRYRKSNMVPRVPLLMTVENVESDIVPTRQQPGVGLCNVSTKNAPSSHTHDSSRKQENKNNGIRDTYGEFPKVNNNETCFSSVDPPEATTIRQPLLADNSSSDENSRVESEGEVELVDDSRSTVPNQQDERTLSIALQVFIPYIIAGFGTVGAGMVLDVVQHWNVFKEVSEVFILVPSLLGLKGNLEMTLASRLSTQVNLGNMNTKTEQWTMIFGNMALVQAQAIVVGFFASVVAMVMGWIPDGNFNIHHGLLLCASSIFTASIASLALGSIMVVVVLLSKKCHINPDNVATPIAASLGDLITLSLLSWVSVLLYKSLGKEVWLAPLIIAIFLLLTPLWVYICVKNKYVNDVIYSGWTPVLCAMVISSIGGLILDYTVGNFHGIAVFQPVINGVGGNLVAVQASRISTYLHQNSEPGILPGRGKTCSNPFQVFCGNNPNARAARALLCLVIPGQILFVYTISYMNAGHTSITLIFNVTYISAAFLQVVILLFLADWMVHFIWLKGEDPDNVAIPYLTAIGDLLGTAFLALAFSFLYYVGDRDADVGE